MDVFNGRLIIYFYHCDTLRLPLGIIANCPMWSMDYLMYRLDLIRQTLYYLLGPEHNAHRGCCVFRNIFNFTGNISSGFRKCLLSCWEITYSVGLDMISNLSATKKCFNLKLEASSLVNLNLVSVCGCYLHYQKASGCLWVFYCHFGCQYWFARQIK